MKRRVGIVFIALLLLVFSILAFRWIKHRMEYAITDAVFVRTEELTNLSFQVSGRVIELKKDMGDRVSKGEVIALLDPTDYELSLRELSARIEQLSAQRQALEVQLRRVLAETSLGVQASGIASQELTKREQALLSQLEEVRVNKEKAYKDYMRFKNLYEKGLIPASKYEEVRTLYESLEEREKATRKNIEEVKLSYERALKEVKRAKANTLLAQELQSQIQALSKQREALSAQRELAQRQVEHTQLRAPFDGVIAKRFVSTGDTVKVGQPIYAMVKANSLYVEALLEEDKLKGVKVGSRAYFRPDAYPSMVFVGEVVQISPASAATFALVPRDVSAGEFTKVVQRIPVKIRLLEGNMELLRVGMGGRVEIERER